MHRANYIFDKNVQCFIHLPKTGGTTLTHIIKKHNLNVDGIDVHRPISEYCSPLTHNYITIIRNPVDRVISYYNMIKRNGPRYPHFEYTSDIKTFLNNCWEVNNQFTLYLAGIDCTRFVNKSSDFQIVNEDIYNLAKENLSRFKILHFDNLSKDIETFLCEHNIVDKNIPALNQHEYNKDVTLDEIKIIEKHNKYDILLYKIHTLPKPC